MRAAPAFAIAVALGACAELPEVPRGTCGNGVVEAEVAEECDGIAGCGAADGANACRFVCDADGAGCPPGGYRCGADLRCRLPTETFTAGPVEVAGAAGVSAQDMDGDGAADLLGHDSRGLLIRWGDADGALAASTRVAMPIQFVPTQAPDVDGNGHRDLALPIGDIGYGLFLGDGGRGFVPAAQDAIAFDFGDSCIEVTAGSVATDAQPQVILALGGYALSFLEGDGCGADPELDCRLSPAGGTLVDGRFVSGRLGYGPGQGVEETAQFSAAVVGATQVSVWGENAGAALRPERIGSWDLDEPIAADGHLAFAQVDGDGCLDLVVDTGTGGSLQVIFGLSILGSCAGLEAEVVRHDRPTGTPLGQGDLDGDGRDEILFSMEVGGLGGPVVVPWIPLVDRSGWYAGAPLVQSLDKPRSALVLDYNRDGWKDLVMTHEGVETVDFLLNYEGAGFSRFPIDVGGQPRLPVVGDFDGDLLDDVVVAAVDPTDPEGRDRTVVIYGEADGRPAGAQFLGDFLAEARPVRVAGGVQPTTDSVLVVSNKDAAEPADCERRLAILIGDTSRQPISPYIHLFPEGAPPEPILPTGVVELSVPGAPRVLALGLTAAAVPGDPPDLGLSVLDFEGTAYVSAEIAAKVGADDLAVDPQGVAFWRAGDLDGDGAPEALALAGGTAIVVRVDGAALDVELAALPDELVGPQWFDLVDLDGDGDLDVLGAGGSPASDVGGDPTAPAAAIWVANNDGGVLDLADPVRSSLPDALYCVDADTIHSDPSGLPQVVGACYHPESGAVLVIGTIDPVSRAVGAARILPIDGDPVGVEVADFTGDGLEDIAVLGSATVTLYRHCRADEAASGDCARLDPLP